MKEFKKAQRKWLNPISSYDTGAIHWDVSAFKHDGYVEANLSLWDCGKKITLALGYSEKPAKQRAKKIDDLIFELESMKQAMAEAYEYVEWGEDTYYE